MKQTAVEWLVEELEMIENSYHSDSTDYVDSRKNAIELAKYMENQQQGYSDEDMLKSFMAGIKCESNKGKNFEQFIKQFKNK